MVDPGRVSLPRMSQDCIANLSDLTGGYAQSLTGRADLQARLLDFLARKKLAVSGSMEVLLRRIETALHGDRLKSTLESLLLRFGRQRREAPKPTGEWEVLMERIQRAGGEGTIDSYPAYLFSFGPLCLPPSVPPRGRSLPPSVPQGR